MLLSLFLNKILFAMLIGGIICFSANMIKYEPRREKTCLQGFANNTAADQPAHPCSLISAFVIRFLKSAIARLAMGKISNF